MRTTFMACAMAAAFAFGGAAQAHDFSVHHGKCGYSTDFDVSVTPEGIDFSRDTGHPGTVFMHDGHLKVDGRDVAVSADDATRLRQYEQEVRGLMPEVAGIAREGVNIGFAAMRTVLMTFAENDSDRHELVDKLDRNHRMALASIDNGLGKGVWKQHAMDDALEQGIQGSVSDLVGKVTGQAVTAALSGDQSKVAALEARADSLDKTIDKEVDKRADELNRRADALCPRLGALEQLQQQFRFRLQDGSRLQLLTHEDKDNKKLVKAADHARAD
ncbi:DUF2884 family protein [Dyella amyloliquefaciens]|uniref:DUF2884 family protein n=1 Tax=Dyella amyloliquefaciens TaxID=1770545 RepID=UPI00102E6343|nr:DUF2884 family protein [Dyella amyloliquefaciens]